MKKIAVGLVAALGLAFPFAGAVRAATDQHAEHTHPSASTQATSTPAAPIPAASTPATSAPTSSPPTSAPSAGAEKRTVVGTVRRIGAAPASPAPGGGHAPHGTAMPPHDLVLVTDTESLFLTGATVRANVRARVTGTVTDTTMHVEAVTVLAAAPTAVPPRGTMKVLVMLAHWTSPDHVTQESAREQMFTDSAAWYRDASYGKVDVTGDVTPWMRIDGPAGGRCYGDSVTVMNQGKAAAAALGYDADDYDNVVIYFPNNDGLPGADCNAFAGWAYVGAPGTWLNGYMDRRVTVHELGHNYGLWHSHSYLCSNVVSGSCGFEEYGDTFDAMGGSGFVGHFSASQKRLLGWLDDRLVDLSAGGTATLAPMASDAAVPLAARVAVSGNRTYWLEHRQRIDFDTPLPEQATDGVLVHVTDPTIAADGGSNLIDVRPGDGLSTFSATLRPGTTWRSPEGFSFTAGAVTTAGVAVTVDDGDGPRCPDLALEPDSPQTAPVVAVPTTQRRGFCTSSDQDWVKFEAVAGQTYRLETLNVATGVNTRLDLFGPDGTVVASDDSTTTRTSRIRFGPEVSGTYLLRAEQVFGAGDDDFAYDLRVALDTGTDAPEVTARTPAPDARGVNRSSNITVTFSEPVTGVGTRTFTLKKAGSSSVIKAKVSRVEDTDQWVLNPSSDLSSDTRYTVTLTGGDSAVRDADGNPLETTTWSFLTGPTPTVKSRTPSADATRINRVAHVVVTFSEAVTGVDESTFTIRDAATGTPVSSRLIRKGSTWELDPRTDLVADTRYTVTLTGGPTAIRDLAGTPLVTTSWTFLTGPTPVVTARTPASGAKNVSRTADLTVTFSEPVTGVVSGTTYLLRDSKKNLVSAGSYLDVATGRWVLDPDVALKASTKYTVTLIGGPDAIRDLAGNPLATTSWSFTTAR